MPEDNIADLSGFRTLRRSRMTRDYRTEPGAEGNARPRMLRGDDPREIRRVGARRRRAREYEQALRNQRTAGPAAAAHEEERAAIVKRRQEIDDRAARMAAASMWRRQILGCEEVLTGAEEAEVARQHEYR